MTPYDRVDLPPGSIAIIGMAGKFPGAESVAEFWRNQLQGIEAIQHFSATEVDRALSPRVSEPGFIAARSVLKNPGLFDAEFFGMYPKEALLTDPQHRLFLEVCWQAFEDAGYDPGALSVAIGVFAGCSMPTYFLSQVCAQPDFAQRFTGGYQVENYAEMIGNSPDFLATRISYKFNLRGPSFTMQSGCSTSLLAVCQACQSLLTYQCDLALAGGSSVTFPQNRGARYQEGAMISPDGHCRTFDVNANGTVFGSGVAAVLLKRLADAFRDGDQIYAVIRGFGVNNDGAAKAGFTAPSIEGQARAIELALDLADVDPETVGYVEAHGTGTPLGDPIELAAITRAFRKRTDRKQFCVIGTAKTNVGHLDIASGVTGLIHAAHVVRHGTFPATLHFQKPNPKLNLDESPFFVQRTSTTWPKQPFPRRAGVSAFGVGGTNAHVILEEPPPIAASPSKRKSHLLVLSARSAAALSQASQNLATHLKSHPDLDLADVAHTLQNGRKPFPYRRAVVAENHDDAIAKLGAEARTTAPVPSEARPVCFLFPGQGSQKLGMAAELYATEPVFRQIVDHCAGILQPLLQEDVRVYLCNRPPESTSPAVTEQALRQTRIAQAAIFTFEFALARLLQEWGIHPRAMLGHSIGEFVAATLSGVFQLDDALRLVARRGALMQQLPPGAMLAVRLSPRELAAQLSPQLSLAAVNARTQCVVSGPFADIDLFEKHLQQSGTPCRRLQTSHAFHSTMMDPILDTFAAEIGALSVGAPQLPYVSNVTGDWVTESLVREPAYWARHLREAVQFASGIERLRSLGSCVFLEVGPGTALTSLVRQQSGDRGELLTISCSASSTDPVVSSTSLLRALGSLWEAGAQPTWPALYRDEQRRRVSLPTYPFERKRFWFEPQTSAPAVNPEPIPQEESEVPTTQSPTPQVQKPSPDRTDVIANAVQETLTELSGIDLSPEQRNATFLELGFDSLFLTQFALALKNKFGATITFRELLADYSSVAALAKHFADILPAEQFASQAATPSASSVPQQPSQPEQTAVPKQQTAPISESGRAASPELSVTATHLDRIIQQQLQAMNQLFAQQLQAAQALPSNGTAPVVRPQIGETDKPRQTSVPAEQKPAPVRQSGVAPQKSETASQKPFGPYKPPQTSTSKDLTPLQRQFLNDLIARYTARTPRSKKLTQQWRSPLADPRVVSGFRPEWKEIVYPIVTTSSKGSRLWDVDGNEYIDILNGFGPIFLGHRPDFIEHAVAEQLHKGFEIGPQSPLAGEVAQLFCELTGNERMTFCNTGSEAVLAAMRVARTVTGRSKVVLFAGAYHGMFDEVLVRGVNANGRHHTLPIAPGIPRESVGNITVLEYGSDESLHWIRQNANDLAAVLVEPVQSRHPALQPVDFLRELRQITSNSGAGLIFDEVVTGFRTHPGGCQALFNIRADLATYGKVLAGGMPIGVLAGRADFMNALDGGMWSFGDDSYPTAGVTFFAGTFVRHPLALAAAKAMLLHLKTSGAALQTNLNRRSSDFCSQLNAVFEHYGVPALVENFSSIFYFHFPPDFWLGSLLYYQLRARGIYILEGFPFFLTTAHTDQDLETILSAFNDSFAELREAQILRGALPPTAPKPGSLPRHDELTPTEPITVPLTEEQLEIALSAQLGPHASCAYNESFTLRLRGSLNKSALLNALQDLVARHDSLRATIQTESRSLLIHPKANLNITEHDFSRLPASDADGELAQIVTLESKTPFDFAQAPLARAHLIRLAENEHALVFTAHHLICDGWSTNVLLSELSVLYVQHTTGTSNSLPPAPQFADYARSQSPDSVDHNALTTIRTYWRDQFKTLPPPLELPTDRPRPAVKSFAGATARAHINSNLLRDLRAAGARQGCTLFATLLAGFATLLHRLTSQDDIVIGIPAAGQSSLQESDLVGHCVNFLPLRLTFPRASSVSKLLTQVRRVVLDGYDHQNYTYGTLVRDLQVPREPGRLPLLEVQFNLEKVGADLHFPGLQVEVDPNPKAAVNFDLFLNAVETPSGLIVDCDYNSDLFDESTIRRWLSHFEILLRGIAADAQAELSRLPILSESERQRILFDWNHTDRDYPRDSRVHDLIEQQARKTPDAVAVTCGDARLTYSDLAGKSNQLAHHLAKIGLQPGDLAAICLERSPSMLVALLAVWKCGAAYVPLDPTHPSERLAFILADANVKILISESHSLDQLPASEARLVCLDRDDLLINRQSQDTLNAATSLDSTAYVIYTSGSTGQPKGVAVTHKNVVNLLCSTLREPGITQSDCLLAVTTLSFDIAALELFLPLISGARVLLAGRTEAVDGNLLRKLIQQQNVTIMQATPATWKLLIEAGWSEPIKILCGGEALSRDLADQLLTRGEVWNMYGPTETTIWSSASRVQSGSAPVTIGPPLANTQFYVLDANLQPVPVGVRGELFIGGDGVALGYHHRPELTSQKFLRDPFRPAERNRIYRTGDLVRFRPDGLIEFLGRTDHQVKIRGFRIELQEVESALVRQSGVREAVVFDCDDDHGLKRLVAYLVLASGIQLPRRALRKNLSSMLPSYMVPSSFVFLDQLPRTPNGKIDRRSLPSWRDQTEAEPATPVKASRLEEQLTGICREILHLSNVDPDASLFELGADSLHLFQIAARAANEGIPLRVEQILRLHTVSDIAEELESQSFASAAADEPTPELKPLPRDAFKIASLAR